MDGEDPLDRVINWVRSVDAPVLASDLVPGATRTQRTHLAAAGGLVRSLVPKRHLRAWPDAVHHWVTAAPTPPVGIADELRAALAVDPDAFASIYCALVAGENRRRLGTFFTPRPVVQFMLDQVPPPRRRWSLVDPGAGVGAFALAAAARWSDVAVAAVDVNVVTLGFLGAALDLQDLGHVELIHDDYLTWLPDQPSDRPRLLVGNPPYTRHQELDRKSKKAMVDASNGLVSSQLAGLSAYFLAASFSSMGPHDALCFVLPSTWTEAKYGRELRDWLWQETNRPVAMHMFPADTHLFPGTKVSAMVLYVGPTAGSTRPFARHRATVTDDSVTTTAREAAPRTGAAPSSLGPWLWHQSSGNSTDRVPLSDLAVVRRGVATGANFFFFLTDDEAADMPEGTLSPALRRLRHVNGDVLDAAEHRRIGKSGKPRWLLTLDDPGLVATPKVQAVLADGRRAGVPDRYLSTVRDPWYRLEHVEPPHLLVGAMTNDRLRVVRNVVRAVHSNSMYGIYLKRPSTATNLASWLNSDDGQVAMLTHSRHYSDGLRKLEPRDLLKVSIPPDAR